MLAYVFWHRPRPGIDLGSYESAVTSFCRALESAAPPGLVSASSASLARTPFVGSPTPVPDGERGWSGPVYEDWYVIEDGAALDVIDSAAVGPQCAAAHGAVASMAADGTAGLYRLTSAAAAAGTVSMAFTATWLDMPAGVGRQEWTARLAQEAGSGSLWTRMLTLGPAPEFCLEGSGSELPGALVIERRPLN